MNRLIALAQQEVAKGRPEEAVAVLERASAEGNTDASAELGLWLLRGDIVCRDVPRARSFLAQAAHAGNEDALLLEIALTANGSGGQTDWPAALALLRQGATRVGYLKSELALLERLELDAEGFPIHVPRGTLIEPRCRLKRFRNFLSLAECQHIANVSVHSLEPSTVFDPDTGRIIMNPIRSSEGTVIGPGEEDLVIQAICRRIAKATGTEVNQGECLSVLRYHPGQEYKPHFDAINGAKNNRIKTVLLYLNDNYTGGQTAFPALEKVVQPKAGDAIVFDGTQEDGSVNPLSRHAGLPVTGGVKWVATRWIRQQPYDPWTQGNRVS